jgi:transmembrane sensor
VTELFQDDLPTRDLPLAPAFDEERVAATWQRIVHARAQRGPMRPVLLACAATALAAVVVMLGVGTRKTPSTPLASRDPRTRVESGQVIEASASDLVLDDGSTVHLENEGRLHVLANDGTQFVTLLDRGPARFHVTPGGPRRWIVETALATVEVVGTTFRVDPRPDRLVVEVERGTVVVRGDRVPGRIVRLTAGEKIVVPAAETEGETTSKTVFAVEPEAVAPEATKPAERPAPVAHIKEGGPPPTEEVVEAPRHDAPLAVDEALREADRLRQEGRPQAAATVLERAVEADPGHVAAGLAAFTLGRISGDLLGEPERAARAFARVIELGKPSSLLEDAHARRAEALVRAGQRREAEAALEAYQRAFPHGPRARALRALLSAP